MSLAISDLSMSKCLTREQFDKLYLYYEMYENYVSPIILEESRDGMFYTIAGVDARFPFVLTGAILGACNNL